MRITSALTDGIRLVNRAPVILGCVFLVTLLTALPLAVVMRDAIQTHLGNSMMADEAARGVNVQWWSEFLDRPGVLDKTFQTTIIGFAAVLDNLSTMADAGRRPGPILWLGAFYLLLWMFLAGGILDRYARARSTSVYEFFAACGTYFVRFLRLAPLAALCYYLIFAVVHPLLFDGIYQDAIRNVTAERSAFFVRLALYLMFALTLAAVNVVFDYAKVRAVVEDRRSMIGALAAGARFVRRNAAGVAGLYFMNTMLFAGVLLMYSLVAPGAESTGMRIWAGVLVSQLYLFARLWVKLVFFASETAFFQGRLAHAGYIASAPPPRPEPAIVERAISAPNPRV
jgi:hypothetical protein